MPSRVIDSTLDAIKSATIVILSRLCSWIVAPVMLYVRLWLKFGAEFSSSMPKRHLVICVVWTGVEEETFPGLIVDAYIALPEFAMNDIQFESLTSSLKNSYETMKKFIGYLLNNKIQLSPWPAHLPIKSTPAEKQTSIRDYLTILPIHCISCLPIAGGNMETK
jgi:hypothetical protein